MDNLSVISTTADARKASRTHLFVGATLYHGRDSTPVRVRNMSPSGALIEQDELPDVGADVILRRGSLKASGRIAWRAGSKAGMAFSSAIHVLDWMPRQLANHQGAVDAIIADYKSTGQARQVSAGHGDMTSVEVELAELRNDLRQLENGLAEDAILVATHPEIQALDVAIQRIDRILRHFGQATPEG